MEVSTRDIVVGLKELIIQFRCGGVETHPDNVRLLFLCWRSPRMPLNDSYASWSCFSSIQTHFGYDVMIHEFLNSACKKNHFLQKAASLTSSLFSSPIDILFPPHIFFHLLFPSPSTMQSGENNNNKKRRAFTLYTKSKRHPAIDSSTFSSKGHGFTWDLGRNTNQDQERKQGGHSTSENRQTKPDLFKDKGGSCSPIQDRSDDKTQGRSTIHSNGWSVGACSDGTVESTKRRNQGICSTEEAQSQTESFAGLACICTGAHRLDGG